jgi:hypothetical protein
MPLRPHYWLMSCRSRPVPTLQQSGNTSFVSPNASKPTCRWTNTESPVDWADLPIRDGRVVVGLDGGYVRDWTERKTNFEVIVGRSRPQDGPARYLGFVHGHDSKPMQRACP